MPAPMPSDGDQLLAALAHRLGDPGEIAFLPQGLVRVHRPLFLLMSMGLTAAVAARAGRNGRAVCQFDAAAAEKGSRLLQAEPCS